MKKFLYAIIIFALGLSLTNYNSYSYEDCDQKRYCVGNALTIETTYGKKAQYLEIAKTKSQSRLDTQITVEALVKPEKQEGKRQFVAGLWGPDADKNDVWVLYISTDDRLVFEIDGGRGLKSVDNTIASTDASALYGVWTHIAAVFDGRAQTASIYIDGALAAQARNDAYPATRLDPLKDRWLPMQIGGCNGLSDNTEINRTMLGQIDEIRIWSRALSEYEIFCQKDISLRGNEADLLAYYRCNEDPNIYTLCDASGNKNFGKARSGACCKPQSGRQIVQKALHSSPAIVDGAISDTLKCVTSKTYRITLTDTSDCGSSVWLRGVGAFTSEFSVSETSIYLPPKTPTSFDLTVDTKLVGSFSSDLQINPGNACGVRITVPVNITRLTELDFSTMGINFGLLLAGCQERLWTDSVVTICNRSDRLGQPRDLTISEISTSMPDVFETIHQATPITLAPGECVDVTVRFRSFDTSGVYLDTLRIISDDKCEGSGVIPLAGEVREVLQLTGGFGERLDSVDFGTVCVDFASKAFNYSWMNIIDENIEIDTIIVPEQFASTSYKYPEILPPNYGFLPNYIRFAPDAEGFFQDSIIFVIKAQGCNIHRVVHVSGKAIAADVEFVEEELDFGTVIIGRERTRSVNVTNRGKESIKLSFYLVAGGKFFLTGARTLNLAPGETKSIPITYVPYEETSDADEICLFETFCYETRCVPIKGKGVYERFEFKPKIMETENVIGCESRLDTMYIKNISGSPQTLNEFYLDPATPYYPIDPADLTAYSVDLADDESARFIFEYIPNELKSDRADRVYLRYKTQEGEEWSGKLRGTSVSPKLYVSDLTVYGTREAGDSYTKNVVIENISPVRMRIDSIIAPEGYVLKSPSKYPGVFLDPREQIIAEVAFEPAQAKVYDDDITVYSNSPCSVSYSGALEGEGVIVPLEVPISAISFGFALPCGCVERDVPLINQSQVNSMSIDSIWFDEGGVANPAPEFFAWRSTVADESPYSISKKTRDTLKILFCPRTTSLRQNVDNSAYVNIIAHGSGWSRTFSIYLTGKRALTIEPSPANIVFPPTRVDVDANPLETTISIPGIEFNPDQHTVTIDSVGFLPDERVFSVLSPAFPQVIAPGEDLDIELSFKPRAVRDYEARLVLHTSEPCAGSDTTVAIFGNSFAPAFGLNMLFAEEQSRIDTFRVVNCDTLLVPIYSSREIPATVVDIDCRLGIDTTKMEYIGSESEYLSSTCPHSPTISEVYSQYGGKRFILKNFCGVDSLKPFIVFKLKPKSMARDTFRISFDSVRFDTEEVILYHIIANIDSAIVVVLEPDFEITSAIDFGVVEVLDCASRTISVLNTGDVPIAAETLLDLPGDVSITGSSPPSGSFVEVGEYAEIYIEFCPRRKQEFDAEFFAQSSLPCDLQASSTISGEGFAPEYEFYVDVSENYLSLDRVEGRLGDTVDVPVYFEKDFSRVFNNTEYWLESVTFTVNIDYNPRSLKYLSDSSFVAAATSTSYSPGKLAIKYFDVDSLRAGQIGFARFLVAVPDSVVAKLYADAADFDSDSILFYDLKPLATESEFATLERCRLNYVDFPNALPILKQNSPNPWTDETKIEFEIFSEDVCSLEIYSLDGELVQTVFRKKALQPGLYSATLNGENLPAGVYNCVLLTRAAARSVRLIKLN